MHDSQLTTTNTQYRLWEITSDQLTHKHAVNPFESSLPLLAAALAAWTQQPRGPSAQPWCSWNQAP
jgi:hypothetical protein